MEHQAPTAVPQTPAAAPAAPSVAQTAIESSPATTPQVAMSHAEMAEGGELQSGSPRNEWGQWIAIGLISLTLVSLIMQIAVHRKNISKMDGDDESVRKDIKELKMNVKKQMGDKYEELA